MRKPDNTVVECICTVQSALGTVGIIAAEPRVPGSFAKKVNHAAVVDAAADENPVVQGDAASASAALLTFVAMAPVSDSNYFPSVGQCLSGEKELVSWKLVATALSDGTGQRQKSSAITKFFDDDYVRGLLREPSTAFAPPDEATNKDFETKTAPINVTSASTDRHDINVFKEDAKWLSRNAKVNLVAALRVVIIEYQSRSSRHLLGPLSSHDAANLQEAAGLQNGQGAAFLSEMGASAALDADEISAEFENSESKKRRLFDTLLTERRFFIMAADYATSIKLYKRLPIFAPGDDSIADLFKLKKPSAQLRDEMEDLLPAYLDIVASSMSGIEAGMRAFTDEALLLNDEVELDWLRSLLTEIVHSLSVVLQVVDCYGTDFPPSGAINQWFSLMEIYGFFDSIQPINQITAELVMPMKVLASAISISLLKPARALAYLSDRDEDPAQADDVYDSYLLSPDVLEQIHKSILDAAGLDSETACPIIFTWSFILHRLNVSYQTRSDRRDNLIQQSAREKFETRSVMRTPTGRRNSAGSIYSIESSKFDGFLENSSTPRDMQVVEQLAAVATAQGRVFDVMSKMTQTLGPSVDGSMSPLISSRLRVIFLELLKVSYPFVGYQSDSVSCLLSLLSPGSGYWDLSVSETLPPSQDFLGSVLQDDLAMDIFFQQALDRYPYEFLPFITLCRTLCTASEQAQDDRTEIILDLLRQTPTITFTLPDTFQEYELVQEDENTNSFCLLEELPLISLSSAWSRRFIEDDAYRIPVGTYGRFITDTGRVVLMEYSHSTLSLLGRRLEISLTQEGYRCELGMLQPDETAEVISLLASLLRMEQLKATRQGDSGALVHFDNGILSEASVHISSGKDIVTVVCETMDYYMQDELAMTEDSAVSVLTACVKFLHAVLQIQPSRVWSYLAKTELLNSESRAGKLTKITGSLDLVSERFEFLTSSLSLFSGLIDTVMSSAVQRRAGSKSTSRQQPESNPWLGTADKVLSSVSFSIAQTSVDVFENTSTWMFESETNRISLLQIVVPILNKIVLDTYDSVFATALSKLKTLKDLETSEALVVLDFVASAQNYWPWTVFTLQKDTAYIDGLRAYVRDLKPSHQTVKSNAVLASIQARIAAYIAETFAMQLYHSRHLGNAETLAKALVNDLDYYLRDGVEVASYNKSLHNNFAKNFSNKYFGCALDNFKRTMVEPRELGENYYYDLDRADEILRFDPGWRGKRKGTGFLNEMKIANANLSLVDAQIALFHAWELLLLELSTCFPESDATKKQMMQVAQQCLNANQVTPGPENIFLKIVDARANLSLILVQRLVKSTLAVKDVNQLLETLIGTINSVDEPFEPQSIAYYRTLLKTLFVTLRAYQAASSKIATNTPDDLEGSIVNVTQTVLNVLDHVVAKGFRTLVSLIHDREADVFPEDLALLTAIMQACLSVPNIEQSQTSILNIMASHDATHAATSLYSWADKLGDQGDPVYGELSILFLLELSTLPALAEQLACDGVLGAILSANLTKFMLRTNVSPYADVPIAQRCYGIWVKGMLPLMLNLLTALGATVAPEITYVLNQFPHLLRASVDRFEAPGASRTKEKSAQYLTLLGTAEVHSLALLTRVLAALRMNNSRDIPAVEWDATGLLENVDYWLSSRRLLKERLLPLGQREMEWRGKKLSGDCDNLLEEKVVAQLETVRDVLSDEFEG
ncbi:nucleoporin NUP188 [Trichoderma asperellum]|uniref:Nucleoporin NUP188 n=1 Tax=Trichoderma asperellum TaxID=101201 RepID=A0A6V8R2Q6_TRIAP|nr:nucleoporin NUP188 [Trichoderma asperellum]